MTRSEIPSTTEIFIDGNIFVYHFSGFSGPTALTPACSAFLRRIENGDLTGDTSLTVVVEVLHRLMIIEATAALQVDLVVPEKIQAMGIHIFPPTFEDLLASREHKMNLGVLTNDALNLAVMKRHNLTHIATNDLDFQRVESLQVWTPLPASPSASNKP